MLRILALAGCIVSAGIAGAQTFFGPGMPVGSYYGGLLFDVQNVSTSDIVLTGRMNFATNWTGDGVYRIYTKSGSYVGSESTLANWTVLGESTVNGAGPASFTLGDVNATKAIGAGQSLGIAIFHVGGSGRDLGNGALGYRNGAGTFDNGTLKFTTGTVKGYGTAADPFAVHSIAGRTWSGELEYQAVPEPATLAVVGLGFAAVLRRRNRR